MKGLLVVILLSLVLPSLPVGAQDLQRGVQNYEAVLSGEKTYSELSREEQEEVLLILRLLRSSSEDGSEECRDARDNARSAAADLANRAKRLMRCAEAEDLSDDCSSKFRRTRSAHRDYESAVSEVQSEC